MGMLSVLLVDVCNDQTHLKRLFCLSIMELGGGLPAPPESEAVFRLSLVQVAQSRAVSRLHTYVT